MEDPPPSSIPRIDYMPSSTPIPNTSLWLHPAVVILVTAILSNILKSIGNERFVALLAPVHSAIFSSSATRKQAALKKELFTTRQELGMTSSQDEFAKWAKLRRKVDKTLADLEVINKSLASSRSSLGMIVRGALFVLTTIAPFAVSTYYRKTPIFWLPPGADLSGPSNISDAADPQVWKGAGAAGNWLGPLGWFLSLPSAPKGAVSATVWNMVCGRIIAMTTAFLVDIAALFGLGASSPIAKPGDQTSLRPANPSPALRSIWYSMGLASCSFAFSQFKHLEAITGSAITKQFGGHYQFLTNISLFLTFVTLLLSLSHTLSPSLPFTRELKTLASIMTMPMEVLVSILYWTVLAIDPKLLIPQKRVDDPLNPGQFVMETIRLPLMVDLSMHAFPAILLLVDFLAFSPPLPLRGITNSWPIYLSTFSTLAYCLWAEICNSQNGRYPYPLLGVLTTPQRLTLYVGCGVTMAVVLVTTDRLHRAVDTKLRRTWSPIKTAGTSRSTGMQTQKQEKVEQGSEKKSGAGETDKTGKMEL